MKAFVRFLICCTVSLGAVYLCGFGNLLNDVPDSLAASMLVMASLVLATLAFVIGESYIHFTRKYAELKNKLCSLEDEISKMKIAVDGSADK